MMNDFILRNVAEDVVCREKIISYLDLIASNPHLSVLNQAMLYFQKQDAGFVCGRRAWEAMGRKVKEEAQPVILYLPEISGDRESGYRHSFQPVNAYAQSDTEGRTAKENTEKEPNGQLEKRYLQTAAKDRMDFVKKDGDLISRILEATGATTELVEREVISDPARHGFFNAERKMFGLERGIDMEGHSRVMTELFIEYFIGELGCSDRLLLPAAEYVVFAHFGWDHGIAAPLFAKLDSYTDDRKLSYLIALRETISEILQILDGRTLSFDETAFVNCLLTTPDKDQAFAIFEAALYSAGDELTAEAMRRFLVKLSLAEDGYIEKLYEKRMRQEVYSYPPQSLHIDEEEYIKRICSAS